MERLHARLIEELSEEFRFVVITGSIDGATAAWVDEIVKVRIPRRPIPLRFAVFALTASFALWRRRGASLVHTCGAIVLPQVDFISVHLCQAGVIAANGGRLAPRGASRVRSVNTAVLKFMARAMERRAFTHGASAMVVAERGRAEIARFYPNTPVILTENAVTDLPAPTVARAAMRQALGVEDRRVILMVGGDWALRGVGLVLEALTMLDDDVVLVVVGRGDAASLRRAAGERGLANRVVLLGQRSDLADLYGAADVFVVASAYETFSLVLVEAARSHLPIVTTNVGVASTLHDGTDGPGLLLAERTPAALAAGIAAVFANPVDSVARAERAFERSQRFTVDRLVSAVRSAYHAAGEGPRS
jgi:glycosyltransferase involved in cell wall biosynthesis